MQKSLPFSGIVSFRDTILELENIDRADRYFAIQVLFKICQSVSHFLADVNECVGIE